MFGFPINSEDVVKISPLVTFRVTNSGTHVQLGDLADFAFKDQFTGNFLCEVARADGIRVKEIVDSPSQLVCRKLIEAGCLRLHVRCAENAATDIVIFSTGYSSLLNYERRASRVRLACNAFVQRSKDNCFVIASPTGSFRVEIRSSWAAGIIFVGDLNEIDSVQEISRKQQLLDYLWLGGMLEPDNRQEGADGMRYWSPIDSSFHVCSRARGDYVARGATYPLAEVCREPEEESNNPDYCLDIPIGSDVAMYGERLDAASLGKTLVARRVDRQISRWADRATITAALYYSTRRLNELYPESPVKCHKPYPSAGAMDELKFYVISNRVADLPRGLYLFSQSDGLVEISRQLDECEHLLKDASKSWGEKLGVPNALVVITADVPKVSWKYESIAYRLILLNCGSAVSVFSLVAQALGLGCCPLGTGDSAAFARLLGKSEWEEAAIMELAITGDLSTVRCETPVVNGG